MTDLNTLPSYLERFVANGALPTTLFFALVFACLWKMLERRFRQPRVLTALLTLCVAAVIGFTFRRDPNGSAPIFWLFNQELWARSLEFGANWGLNLLLFVPASLLLALYIRRPMIAWFSLVALSFAAECFQHVTRWGIGDPSDFVANGIGTTVGVVAAVFSRGKLSAHRAAERKDEAAEQRAR